MQVPILYFIDLLYFHSGTEKHLFELLQHIDRERFKPYVITCEGAEDFKQEIEDMGIPVQILDINKVYGKKEFHIMKELKKFIKKESIKIIQTFHINPDIYGTVLAKFSGIPIVISSRRDMGFNRNKNNIICYKFLNNFVDKIICVSEAVKQLVIKEEGVKESKIKVIYNGIRQDYLDKKVDAIAEKQKFGFNGHTPIVGMLANFNPIKGHFYFLEAAALIKNEIPEVQFVLAGRGPFEPKIREKTAGLGLNDCVHFIGHRRDIPETISIMDILVVPSLSEGFSNTVIEALYMRKPIVATNVGGNPEAVINNKTGILVPPESSTNIAQSVFRLLENEALRRELGNNGRRLVEERFLFNKMISETINLYEELLRKKRVKI